MKMNLVSFLNLRPGTATCAASICSNTSFFYTDLKPVNGNTVLSNIAPGLLSFAILLFTILTTLLFQN